MTKVTKHGVILNKTDLPFENEGVLNPAAIRDGNGVHLFYRAVAKGNFSSIGYCRLKDPLNVDMRLGFPVLSPQFEYESHGMEDPRIVKIDDVFYLSYTAYDGVNALGALAVSRNLKNFDRKGIIVPQIKYADFNRLSNSIQPLDRKYVYYNEHERLIEPQAKESFLWDKNLIFFPRRINGKLTFLHRIKPEIQIVVGAKDLSELTDEFWQDYFIHFDECVVLSPKYEHELNYIGGGCPPIETPEGWLMIYHGVHSSSKGYVYSACAALLDLDDPRREIARLPHPLFFPEYAWELKGEVNNVCFPTGAVLFDERLYIYYGAADERIACASVSLSELLAELLSHRKL